MMVKQFVPILGFLFIMIFAAVFGPLHSADAQKVHALLIILGNDRDIRASVEKNESNMQTLLRQVSENCEVHMTVMKSETETIGTITRMTLSNTGSTNITQRTQGIISAKQVVQWIRDLSANGEDTILIYYSGHGSMQGFNDHILNFDQETGNKIVRAELRRELERKKGSLKMLITDTCSNRAITREVVANTPNYLANVDQRIKPSYIKNLLLQHAGILDITAAQPGQYAWSDPYIGGFFTSGLFQSITDKSADTNQDGFLTWQEIFKTTQQKTNEFFKETKENGIEFGSDFGIHNQETQKPFSYSLPRRTR